MKVDGVTSDFFKELCKVESSTDSDSEISPRWSDTSTLVFLNVTVTHTISTYG